MILKEVVKGPFWKKKRYYLGLVTSTQQFMIDADWFDTLPKPYQETVYRRECVSAYKRSLPREFK